MNLGKVHDCDARLPERAQRRAIAGHALEVLDVTSEMYDPRYSVSRDVNPFLACGNDGRDDATLASCLKFNDNLQVEFN